MRKKANTEEIKITDDEKFLEAFAQLYKTGIDMCFNDIKATETRIKMWTNILEDHYSNEPFKIFKKTHNEWKIKKEEYENILNKLYSELEECYSDYIKLVENPKFT